MSQPSSNTQKSALDYAILTSLTLLTLLLFISDNNIIEGRLLKQIWQLGHFVLFSLFTFSILKYTELKNISPVIQIIFLASMSLCLGLVTEILQQYFNRSFEFDDIISDFLGGISGFVLYQALYPYDQKAEKAQTIIKQGNVNFLFIGIFFLLALFSARNIFFTLYDQSQLQKNFPLIATFDTPFELSRWEADRTVISRVNDNFNQSNNTDNKALQVIFKTAPYSTASMIHLPKNWQGYDSLSFDLNLQGEKDATVMLKIFDHQHPKNQYVYNDRFNHILNIPAGFSTVKIPLTSIQLAPQNREMDLQNIHTLSFFTTNLSEIVILHIDNLKLTKKD